MLMGGTPARDRWRHLVTPATGLWAAGVVVALRAGQPAVWRRIFDVPADRGFNVATLVIGVLGAGLVATVLAEVFAGAIRPVWLGYAVPRPFSTLLLRWRRRRWRRADDQAQDEAATDAVRRQAERRRTRIALAMPESPTWMGDRVAAAQRRVRNEYGLDLPSAWSRLWLVMPSRNRLDLREAQADFDSAARWMGWAVIFVVTALVWWPLAGVAVVIAARSVQSGRAAVVEVTDLSEAAVDIYATALARRLGVTVANDWLEVEEGKRVNRRIRKGS